MNLNIIPNILYSPRPITMPLVPFNGFVNGINIPNPPNRILIGHPEQHLVVPYPLINKFRIIDNNQPVILNSTNINDLINELNYHRYGNISNRLVSLRDVFWRNKYLKYKTKYMELKGGRNKAVVECIVDRFKQLETKLEENVKVIANKLKKGEYINIVETAQIIKQLDIHDKPALYKKGELTTPEKKSIINTIECKINPDKKYSNSTMNRIVTDLYKYKYNIATSRDKIERELIPILKTFGIKPTEHPCVAKVVDDECLYEKFGLQLESPLTISEHKKPLIKNGPPPISPVAIQKHNEQAPDSFQLEPSRIYSQSRSYSQPSSSYSKNPDDSFMNSIFRESSQSFGSKSDSKTSLNFKVSSKEKLDSERCDDEILDDCVKNELKCDRSCFKHWRDKYNEEKEKSADKSLPNYYDEVYWIVNNLEKSAKKHIKNGPPKTSLLSLKKPHKL